MGYSGIAGVLALLLTIWALVGILQSGADGTTKLIWVLVVILLPIVGFVLWYLMGPGSKALPGRGTSG